MPKMRFYKRFASSTTVPRQRCCYGQTTSASAAATPQHSRLQATERPSTGAHATPAGNNWTKPDSTYRVRPHQTVGLDGCQLLFPVAKWVGVYRSVQRPHPIAPQVAVFEYMDKWNKRMFFIRDHNHVVVVFDGRVNPPLLVRWWRA